MKDKTEESLLDTALKVVKKNQTIEEYDDLEKIQKETFNRTKRITKKMVKELVDSRLDSKIEKIESPEDLEQLIKDVRYI